MECDYGVKDEYQAIESRRGWQPLFSEIREKSANFSIAESKKIANRDLNRYRDVNPFDHSRIILKRGNCSYINASLVKVQAVERAYILTQGPLPSTVSHFWSMVWEQNCKIIAMLNNTIEKNQVKCHTYWPEGIVPSILNLEDVQLTVELIEEDHKQNYILRTFRLADLSNQETRLVKQYHYTTWPDFGVPATPSDFIQYLQDIRNTGGLGPGTKEEPIGPAVVHCSAGIGRSGTFCIVDTALLQLERGERVNVKELLLEMRRYRMGLIQTAEQLRFSYLSIIKGAESMNIDLRWIPPVSGSASCSDSDSESSGSEDDSDNPEEVEEEDDVTSSDAILTNQLPSYQSYSGGNSSIAKIISENDAEELPPPIPPRAESLRAPDYDRPLPLVPAKRAHPGVEVSTASETEEDPVETDSVVEDASGSECERKRRKQTEEIIPRAAESDNGGVRQRRQERQEKNQKTQQLISSIKEKQKEQDRNSDLQGKVIAGSKWVGISVGIFILVCAGFRYFQGS